MLTQEGRLPFGKEAKDTAWEGFMYKVRQSVLENATPHARFGFGSHQLCQAVLVIHSQA